MLHPSNRILPYSMSLQFWEEKKNFQDSRKLSTQEETLFCSLNLKQNRKNLVFIIQLQQNDNFFVIANF